MKDKQKKKLTEKQKNKILILSTVVAVPLLSLAAVIIRALALFTDFDGADYFLSLTSLPSAYLILSLAVVFVVALFAILLRKRMKLSEAQESTELPLLFSSAFLSVTLAATLLVSIFSAISSKDPLISFFHALIAVLAALTVGYLSFFLRGVAPTHSLLRTYLSLSPVLLTLSAAILLYFDHSTQINSPAKLLALAAFLSLALTFLVECRYYFTSPRAAMRYLTLGIGFYLSISASLPNLIYTLARGNALVLSSVYDFLLFAFALYLLARLLELLPERDRETHGMVCNAAAEAVAESEEQAGEEPTESTESVEAPSEATAADAPAEPEPEATPAPKKSTKKTKKAE